jgi:WD40 repeat protein
MEHLFKKCYVPFSLLSRAKKRECLLFHINVYKKIFETEFFYLFSQITCLNLSKNKNFLITGSIDRRVNIINLDNFDLVDTWRLGCCCFFISFI